MTESPLAAARRIWTERRAVILLWGGIVVCLTAAAVVRAVFLFKDSFATGFDGYYYALQVRSLIENGEVLNNDNSFVYPLLRFFALFFNDVVVSNKIAAIVLCSLTVVPFYLLTYRLTSSHISTFAAALFFTLSFSQIYMSFEILKNGISLLFALWCVYCLARFFDRWPYKVGALVFFALGFFTHKATACVLIVLVLAFGAGAFLVKRRSFPSGRRRLIMAAAAAAGVLIVAGVVFLSLGPLRLLDLQNLWGQFRLESVWERFRLFAVQVADTRIKSELFLLYAVPLVFIPFLISFLRDPLVPARHKIFIVACYITQWTLLNPFLEFSWESASYRLVLISLTFTALEIALILARVRFFSRRIPRVLAAAVLTALVTITLPGMWERFHTDRYPPYSELNAAVVSLKQKIPPGGKLVCQAGLSFFIWYTTRIYTEHFLPEDPAGYYRLAYGIGPDHFGRYEDNPGYEEPVEIRPPYTLVKESVWRMFYREYASRLRILTDWHNPSRERPPFVYAVKPQFRK